MYVTIYSAHLPCIENRRKVPDTLAEVLQAHRFAPVWDREEHFVSRRIWLIVLCTLLLLLPSLRLTNRAVLAALSLT